MQRFVIFACFLFYSELALAGGPAYVAGGSYFDPATKGSPVVWAQGRVNYYTDQGNLSAILPGASADSFVAAAFSPWTSIPTAAVSASRAGQLAEDVNGRNVSSASGSINLPADIQPSATGTPVGIVYDYDGAVTDALLGSGASNALYCGQNSVFGGVDNIASDAHFAHALIVINGNCAATSAQLPDLQYHLVRVIGRVLGLDWSQVNLTVITHAPTAADYAGFSIMHQIDPPGCVPVARCYSNNGLIDPSQPKLDDQLALSKLYPVTAQSASSFPGKQIFGQSAGRIHGSVYFDNGTGQAGQAMQGVNVVARWIDPATGVPSRAYVSTSISGFLFRGNAGNIVSGYTNALGQNFDRFGSDDPALEGYFDLPGLPLPGGIAAQYELTVEPIDPLWMPNAGPYGATGQVKPSGMATPIVVNVSPGGSVQQDVLMFGGAVQKPTSYGQTSYAAPAQVPANGAWTGSLSPYGTTDFFQFAGRANRSLSLIVTAIDESAHPSTDKSMPVIGLWGLLNPGQTPAPAFTPSAFNTSSVGTTRLDAQVLQTTSFRLGIADYRGDGRPDFNYTARVFYADQIAPSRGGVAGGAPLTVSGMGFQANTTVQLANSQLPVLAGSASQLLVNTPPLPDGVYDLSLNDPTSGGASRMAGVLTVGAGPTDTIKVVAGTFAATPVGAQASGPFSVMVVQPDGVTPVAGASVQISASPPVAYSACGGASNCTLITDATGVASTRVTVLSATVNTLTATLAPASYANPQRVQSPLLGTTATLAISLPIPSVSVAQGATVTVPITAQVLANGLPMTGTTVNYQVTQGNGTLTAGSAQTNGTGFATVNLQLNALSAGVQLSVCVAPANNPCQVFRIFAAPANTMQLQVISGTLQTIASGQNFQPVVVRVTDSASPPNAVLGAGVLFFDYIGRVPADEPIIWAGEAGISKPVMPVILGTSQATLTSDANGLVSFPLSTGGFSGNIAVVGSATSGSASINFAAQQFGP